MITSNKLQLTGSKFSGHLNFWKDTFATVGENYNYTFKQTWNSYTTETLMQEYQVYLNEKNQKIIAKLSQGGALNQFEILLTGIYILLSRYGNQEIIQIDTPLNKKGALNSFSISEIPLIQPVLRECTILELINNVQKTVSKSYSFQDFPINEIYKNVSSDICVYCPDIHLSSDISKYKFLIKINIEPEIGMVFSAAEGFSTSFLKVLEVSLNLIFSNFENLETPIEEINWKLNNSNGEAPLGKEISSADSQSNITVHSAFEEQVRINAQRIAIKSGYKTISYEELNIEAEKLASWLKNKYSIARGDVIGVVMENSEWLIIAMLGIMKAGGIYFPINPDAPDERIKYLVNNSNARLLIIDLSVFSKVGRIGNIPSMVISAEMSSVSSSEELNECVSANDVAYLMYTSGSSGLPKGVLIEHKSFVNMIVSHVDAFTITCDDSITLFSPPSFDASLLQIFLALVSGASLIILSKNIIQDPNAYLNCLDEKNATIAILTPSYLQMVDKNRLSKIVRTVITGGEAPNMEDALLLTKNINYFNSYGPTEASVCTTYYKVDTKCSYGKTLPIGKPILNTTIAILDSKYNQLPDGVIGEIAISGTGLARGYVNNGQLTSEKFIVPPGGENTYYLTGDLGIRLPDGNFEYAGRADTQVKINGYRIELQEVRQNLLNYPSLTQAVVVKKDNIIQDACIVAYFVSDKIVDINDLRAFLKEMMPSYMVPYFINQIDHFPLTPNGKIDENALPDPQLLANNSVVVVPPRNETDAKILEIWQDVLAKPKISIEDNFFDLGGTSLQVIRVFELLNNLFPGSIKISELFDYASIVQQSDLVSKNNQVDSNQSEFNIVEF